MSDLHFDSIKMHIPGRGPVRVNGKVLAGEIVVIQGPSGCGKSTLLRMVAGLQKPIKGKVFLGDEEISSQPPHTIGVGLVFQNGALFPHMTVFDNIAFGLRFLPKFKDWSESLREKRVEAMLEAASISELRDRFPDSLSGGERQRVALLRSMAYEPRVLLLDEPLSAVDPAQRLHLQEWIVSELKVKNIPTLIVTHDKEEAEKMASRVVSWNPEDLKF